VLSPPASVAAVAPGRVVAWNTERGRDVPSLARVLRSERPSLVLLSEMDLGMARTCNRHTARELAGALGYGCVYGVEFVELGLGDPQEREASAGATNSSGFHGGALLSAAPLERGVVVRLEEEGAWFTHAEREELRVGGRIAVLATWRLAGEPVTVAAVHLESNSTPEQRGEQMARLFDAVERYAPGSRALIGGDFNTFSLSHDDLLDRDVLRGALERDGDRLRSPVAYEPLFEIARERGFAWEICNVMGEATHRVASEGSSGRGGLKLDWVLARGLTCGSSEVLEAAHPDDGHALSDHEPIATTCEL
jgi:endonuclease/exonuclease/phosphatase family metal-dependent hydrolase